MTERQTKSNERGVTLVETLAVVAVMGIIIAIVAQVFSVSLSLVTRQMRRSDTAINAALAMRNFSDLTRGAAGIMASHDFSGTVRDSDGDSLVLNLPAVDGTGLMLVGLTDYIAFYRDPVDPTKILYDIAPATGSYRLAGTRVLTSFNDAFILRYNNPVPADASRVSVYLENSRSVRDDDVKTAAWTSIFLRN